jgi:hypothetical protein
MRRSLRWSLPVVAALVVLSLIWLGLTTDPDVTVLRNVLEYQIVKALGGPKVRTGQLPGTIAGTIRDAKGTPIAGATVLVASALGQTHTAESGPDGRYELDGVPPGRYVPVAGKRGYQEDLPQLCLAGLCYKNAVTVRPGRQVEGIDLSLKPIAPIEVVTDASLIVSATQEIEVGAPFPSKALRAHISFERAGLRVDDCYLYEPLTGDGPFPTLLLVLPGPVLNWEIVPVPFASEGYSVLAFYPLRGIDLDQDVADILTALEYLRRGRIPSRADTDRLVLVGASFTSLHAYRQLALTEGVDVSLVLGGMADGFAFRHEVEMGTAQTRPPFDQVLMALGFPNSSPELYFRYSSIFHLEGLPPLCLLHGKDDELSPFSQSVELADELERRGMPYEFHAYEGLSHYFSTSADNATTQQMFQDSLDCLERFLTDSGGAAKSQY